MDRKAINPYYDYVIVGGGINGIGVYSELVKLKKNVLLIEAKDFMGQTSSRSSKMLHGGIRYLETFDFGLVYEALREKNYWLKQNPKLCKEQKFFIPVYEKSPNPHWKLSAGVKLYDSLSLFKNKSSRSYSRSETLKALPFLNSDGLTGSVSYYDAIVDDYGLGMHILDTTQSTEECQAIDHCRLTKVEKRNNFHIEVQTQEKIHEIECHKLIFTTGPFTDQVMRSLDLPWNPHLILSRGSHLFLRKDLINIDSGIVIQEGNRIIFVIPHQEYILLGTTEHREPDDVDLYSLEITESEKLYLIDNFQRYFPESKINDSDILKTTTGVRPLVKDMRSSSPGKVRRHHEIFRMKDNCYVMVGGKYTTFRSMAQDLVSRII